MRGSFEKAGNGTRTRDTLLGKQVLYQLSYTRKMLEIIGFLAASVKVWSEAVQPKFLFNGIVTLARMRIKAAVQSPWVGAAC